MFAATCSRSSSLGNRVRVRVGPLTAEITAASAERLGLAEGEPVIASFKATAARLVSLGLAAGARPRRPTPTA